MSADININIHITADNTFVQALSDIACCLAAVTIAKTGNTQAVLPQRPASAPTAPAEGQKGADAGKDKGAVKKEVPMGKPATSKEEKAINDMLSVPAPSDPKPSPDAVIDKKLLPRLREAAGAYCKRVGDINEGKENVRNWLHERNLQGLSTLTYKDMDDFIAFMGKAVPKEEAKESA
jgi:hypothetical protein